MERQIILELLFLTLSGTALGLLFCLFRPLTGKVFSFRWHYYLWLIVLLRLILPVHVDMGIFPAPAVFSPAQTAGIEETGNATGETEGAGTDAADAKADMISILERLQGDSILDFPPNTQRKNVRFKGGFILDYDTVYSKPSDYSDYERIRS